VRRQRNQPPAATAFPQEGASAATALRMVEARRGPLHPRADHREMLATFAAAATGSLAPQEEEEEPERPSEAVAGPPPSLLVSPAGQAPSALQTPPARGVHGTAPPHCALEGMPFSPPATPEAKVGSKVARTFELPANEDKARWVDGAPMPPPLAQPAAMPTLRPKRERPRSATTPR